MNGAGKTTLFRMITGERGDVVDGPFPECR